MAGGLGTQVMQTPAMQANKEQFGNLGVPSAQGGGGKGGAAPQNPYMPNPMPFQSQNYGAARFMNPGMQPTSMRPMTYQAPATNFGSLVGGNFGRPMYGPSFGGLLSPWDLNPGVGAGPGGPGAGEGVGIGGSPGTGAGIGGATADGSSGTGVGDGPGAGW